MEATQVQVIISGNVSQVAAALAAINDAGIMEGAGTRLTTTTAAPDDKPKRVRRTQAQIAADEAAAAAAAVGEQEEDEAPAEEEQEEDDLGLGDEEPAKVTKAPKLSLDKDVIPACQAFVKKHDKAKLAKELGKYKIKSVRDLPVEKYEEFIKALKKA